MPLVKQLKVSGKFNPTKFAKLLKSKREEFGYSMSTVAMMIGKNKQQIQRYESSDNYPLKNFPPLDIFVELCIIYNINPNELLNVNISEEEIIKYKERLIEDYEIKKDRMYWDCHADGCIRKKNVDYDEYNKMSTNTILNKKFECEHCGMFYNGINPDKLKYNIKFKTTIR
jgi:transcriptional regulator with XRE-family HTH domain